MTMKYSMLINSNLPNNFWVKVIKTINYVYNKFSIKNRNYSKVISEKVWIRRRQNLKHICIFGSFVLANISKKRDQSLIIKKLGKIY